MKNLIIRVKLIILNAYKSPSSRIIKKEFSPISNQLWKQYFWRKSYCLITTGGAPIDIVRKYIESQVMKSGEKMLKAYKFRVYPNEE